VVLLPTDRFSALHGVAIVVAGIEDDIEEVEQEDFDARTESIQRIYFLKR